MMRTIFAGLRGRRQHRNGGSLRRKHSRAFTLIELLVVVAIIMLLAALLFPALKNARRRGRVVVCVSNMRQYALGLHVYASDYSGYYPPNPSSVFHDPRVIWTGQYTVAYGYTDMQGYLDMFLKTVCGGNGKILFCPLDEILNVKAYEAFYGPGPIAKYRNHFAYAPTDNYYGGYLRLAGFTRWGKPDEAEPDWSNSGNDDVSKGPLRADSGKHVIICDIIWSDVNYGDTHANVQREAPTTHRDNNVTYGDGHVETHNHTITDYAPYPHWNEHYVRRTFGGQYLLY